MRSRAQHRTALRGGETAALGKALRARTGGEVRFDPATRAAYSTDASNYRQVPICVVLPRTLQDAIATVDVCREAGVPILNRGGGTSLAGQGCNVAVVIDWSKHMQGFELFPDERRAVVEPGTICDAVRSSANRYGLTFGPDPATHGYCTFGGMIGNDSCGPHSVMSGRTVDNVEQLDVLLYDGTRITVGPTSEEELSSIIAGADRRAEIYGRLRDLRDRYADEIRARYPAIPRRVSGYNLDQLLPENGFNVARALVGSEGTLVTILGATVRLMEWPAHRSLIVAGYDDVCAAADYVPELVAFGPLAVEGLDQTLIEAVRARGAHRRGIASLPVGRSWLMIELGGQTREEAEQRARDVMRVLEGSPGVTALGLLDDPKDARDVWSIRESALGASAFMPGKPDAWAGWEDAAVAPEQLGAYLREFRDLNARYGYESALYGHFGQGCVHCRMTFDLRTADGIAKWRAYLDEAADLVVAFGGSLSGEHGDGQQRAELLPKMFGSSLMAAFREFKSIWDPGGTMNPGKVVDPYPITEHLRLGTAYRPRSVKTHFSYREDGGDFARASLRCVGIGTCRRPAGGTMCPSYMATKEELHSTRGRARLLFEMMRGESITSGWRSEEVHQALDLCLACKGCKSDCSTGVDMATYKAEFVSHHYKGRVRPRQAYALGLIYWWARVASHMPRLANAVTHARGLATLTKRLGGIAPERDAPVFAEQPFRAWFARHEPKNPQGMRVVLWPDTFNNFFHPHVARATVEVLEAAGCRVELPPRILCCGRPLYDYGMLDLAKRLLEQTVRALRDDIAAGTPIVGMEPSCVAVFRDELPNLLHDEDAKRLSKQVFTLAEFLQRIEWKPPPLERAALYFGHCHQRSIMGTGPDTTLLDEMGVDLQTVTSTCCGLAGSFGFEAGERYEVSIRAGEGEHGVLPKVRAASLETLVVADGFSCRTQIGQQTDRDGIHLAQVLQMALRDGSRTEPS
ncbi:MAG: FAD-binding and (Fe-S)-binding domain-containing protein [Actinomycetota bacterium]